MSTIKEYSEFYTQLLDTDKHQRTVQVDLDEWDFNVKDSATEYLPENNKTNITIGVTTQKTICLDNFDHIDLRSAMPHKKGYVVNTGGSIWGLDVVPHQGTTQYLAVGGYRTTKEHHYLNEDTQQPNAIQVWKWSDEEPPQLSFCILHSLGAVVDLKWCPLNLYNKNMLGVLAVLLNTGRICIFVVPHPDSILETSTIYWRATRPRLILDLPRTKNLCFAWGWHGLLASGTIDGRIVIWDILESIKEKKLIIRVNLHNTSECSIRVVTWRSLMDPHIIIASDIGGNVVIYDLQDPCLPWRIFGLRSPYICITGTGHGDGFIFSDLDTARKTIGFDTKAKLTLTAHHSLIWSLTTSPHHGIMGSVSSDGYAKIKPFSDDKVQYTQRHKNFEYTLYILEYDKETNTFRYIDGIKPKVELPQREYHSVLKDPIVSLNRITWNTNLCASGWIVSGGTAGLCRLEYTGL